MMNTLPDKQAPDVGIRLDASQVMQQGDGYALRASCCPACGQATFPSSSICPFCLAEGQEDLPLAGRASLYTFTRVHVAPAAWQTPYAVGYADFPNGLRLLAKLADAKTDWRADQPVQLKVQVDGDSFRYYLQGEAA